MVNVLRYKIMSETTEKAISRYSEHTYSASWLNLVEDEVFYLVQLEDPFIYEFFTKHELACMKDMQREGKWLKRVNEKIVFYTWQKQPKYESIDYDNCVNGAD